MKNTGFKVILIMFVISLILIGFCAHMIVDGFVSIQYAGFGVDSDGNLYVGWGHKISVYENGTEIYTIERGTSRGYYFAVQGNDTIILSTSSNVIVMDLYGEEVLESWVDYDKETYNALKEESKSFTLDGDEYTANLTLGQVTIFCNNDIIYKSPDFDRFVICLTYLSAPCFFISTLLLAKYIRKRDWRK